MSDEIFDPDICAFCEKGSPVGGMLFVFANTQTLIPNPAPKVKFPACAPCGLKYTDSVAGTNLKGETAVLQFEHDDYIFVTSEQHANLVEQFETNECSVCGEVLWPEGHRQRMPTETLVTKMLRQAPEGVSLSHVCGKCTELGLCPDCDGTHDHE